MRVPHPSGPRSTARARVALRVFPRRVVQRLSGYMPRFVDKAARTRFARDLREWVYRWHPDGGPAPRSMYQDPRASAVRDELRQVAAAAEALHERVEKLSTAAAVRWNATAAEGKWHPVVALTELDRIADTAAEAADAVPVRRGPPEDALLEPLRELAWLWSRATGKRPSVTTDRHAEGNPRRGPFVLFARDAMRVLWPRAGDMDGLLDRVSREFREGKAKPPGYPGQGLGLYEGA